MIIRLESDLLSAEVSDLGAELKSLVTSDGVSLLWHGDPAFWSGRSPILFPIVGKAPEDMIEVGGQLYPMPQHGFARRSLFQLTEQTGNFCRHDLTPSDTSRAAYPFEFRLSVSHRLSGAALFVEATVENTDQDHLLFGLGFHPAFAWPLPWALNEPHFITLDNHGEPERAFLTEGLMAENRLPSPFRAGRLVLNDELFAQDALIFPEGAGDALRYGPLDGRSLRFRTQGLPNLALWTKPGAPFLCIEPWHGMAASLRDGHALDRRPYTVKLPPGGSQSFGFSVTLEASRSP